MVATISLMIVIVINDPHIHGRFSKEEITRALLLYRSMIIRCILACFGGVMQLDNRQLEKGRVN